MGGQYLKKKKKKDLKEVRSLRGDCVDQSGSNYSQVASSCEEGNEPSPLVRWEQFLK